MSLFVFVIIIMPLPYAKSNEECKSYFPGSAREECEITIWEKPWENFIKVVEQSCKSAGIGTDEKDVRKEEPPLIGKNIINHKRGKYAE